MSSTIDAPAGSRAERANPEQRLAAGESSPGPSPRPYIGI